LVSFTNSALSTLSRCQKLLEQRWTPVGVKLPNEQISAWWNLIGLAPVLIVSTEVRQIISQATIGLDADRASADHMHLYHGNAALLTESLEVI
jgi:hypothetical protein